MDHIATIDVHTHVFPPTLPDLAKVTGDHRWPALVIHESAESTTPTPPIRTGMIIRGDQTFRAVTATTWDLASRLTQMDASGVDQQVLSPVPVMLTTWAEPKLAASFARSVNEAMASLIRSSSAPTRFRWLGTAPLQDPVLAIAEIEYGLTIGMSGLEIGTEVGGLELDDPTLLPIWDFANQVELPIFIHPTDGGGATRRSGGLYEFALGMQTDTALAASALTFGGILEAFPKLRIGLSHGCGTFPWAFPRLARGATLGHAETVEVIEKAATLIRRLWADTLVFDQAMIPLLIERFGAEHLMLGSDFPFYPASWGDPLAMIRTAASCGSCTAEQATAIAGPNAANFLSSRSTEGTHHG